MAFETTKRAEAYPTFGDLTFNQQQEVRSITMLKDLQENYPEFNSLPDRDKKFLLSSLVTSRKPVYADPEFADVASDFAARIEEGDKRAIGIFLNNLGTRSAMNTGMIASAVALASMKVNDWLSDSKVKGPYIDMVTSQFLKGSDSDKFYAYASQNLFKDNSAAQQKLKSSAAAMQTTGGVSGFVTDLVAMWAGSAAVWGTAGTATKAGFGAAKLGAKAEAGVVRALSAGKIGTTTAKIGGWASRVGIPASADALLGGMYGVARENVIALATDDHERLTDDVKEFGRAFGEFAAWDLVLGMAMPTVLGFSLGAGRKIFGKGDDIVRARMSDVEFKALRKRFGDGQLEKIQFEQLDDVGQDMYVQQQAVRSLGGKVEDLNTRPLLRAQVDANNNGYHVRQLDDGKIRVTNTVEVTKGKRKYLSYKQDTYESLLDAETAVANDLIGKRKFKWTAKQIADFDSNPANARLLRLGTAVNNASENLDVLYKMDLDDASRKAIKAGRSKSFVSPVKRLGVTQAEADEVVKNSGGILVGLGEPDTLAKQLRETPRRFLKPGQTHTLPLFKGEKGIQKGLLSVRTPAPDGVYKVGTEYAQNVLKKDPTILESKENLRALFLLENGFDSHFKRAKDGSISAVETFIPNRVRTISEFEELRQAGKIDNIRSPKKVRVNNQKTGAVNDGTTLVGNEDAVKQYLTKYTNKRKLKNLTEALATDKYTVYQTPRGTYQLEMPEAGLSREFKNIGQAKRFANKRWDKAEAVLAEAERRGIDVKVERGKYKFATPEGAYYAETSDQVKEFFRKHGEPSEALEIFEELDPGFTNRFEDVIMAQDQMNVPPGTMTLDLHAPTSLVDGAVDGDMRIHFKEQAGRVISQTDYLMEQITNKLDIPEVAAGFNNMKRATRITNGQMHQALEMVYSDIYTTPTGVKYWKPKYRDRRRMISYYIAGQGDDAMSAAKYREMAAKLGDLTEDELSIAKRVEEAYDTFGKRFGIPIDKWIKKYQPRIREFYLDADNAEFLKGEPLVDEVLPKIFGGEKNVPRELRAWFMEDRTLDMLQFAIEDDSMFMLIKYIDKGLGVQHIQPAWSELQRSVNAVGSADLKEITTRFAAKSLNTFYGAGEKVMGKLGHEFAQGINNITKGGAALSPKDGANMMDTLYTLNYLTNMAYRPWLAIRNSFQVWTTLASRMGNQPVGEAIRLANKEIAEGADKIPTLMRLGLLNRKPPILGELGGLGTKLNRVSHNAFKMFKGSDDYTRLIAYNTGDVLLERGFKAVRNGDIDLNTAYGKKAFFEVTGLRKTDKFLAEELFEKTKRAFKNGEDIESLTSVKLSFGQKLIDDTMFIYDSSQSPMMFDGVVGKAFGRYGTYSVGYRANIWRGLKEGTTADKVGFITRFMGNQAALWAAFTAVGIKASNFIPGQPALFSGGPLFDLGLTLIRSTDTLSYGGRQARGELGNALQQLVPGTLQYAYLKKAIDYADQGNWWKAFLSITSTPVTRGPSPFET